MTNQISTLKCLLKNQQGKFICSTYNRNVLIEAQNNTDTTNELTTGLQNLVSGEKRTIALSALHAFGPYNPKKIILFPRNKLPKQIQIGQKIEIVGKSGEIYLYKILQTHGDLISLDQNHPLAGQDLIFDFEVVSVRAKTTEDTDIVTLTSARFYQ